ncbi:MAG: hypothetical protein WBB68_04440 [Candidatus Moraniibacteriota bacterium]
MGWLRASQGSSVGDAYSDIRGIAVVQDHGPRSRSAGRSLALGADGGDLDVGRSARGGSDAFHHVLLEGS